jgi:hypothetical protein
MANTSPCHGGNPGSNPGRGVSEMSKNGGAKLDKFLKSLKFNRFLNNAVFS